MIQGDTSGSTYNSTNFTIRILVYREKPTAFNHKVLEVNKKLKCLSVNHFKPLVSLTLAFLKKMRNDGTYSLFGINLDLEQS